VKAFKDVLILNKETEYEFFDKNEQDEKNLLELAGLDDFLLLD
jgi:hypothetical protein